MTTGKRATVLLKACALLLCASGVSAQTLISPEEFLDEAEGRTLSFYNRNNGRLVGVEQFLSRTRTVWRQYDAGCVYGEVTIENGLLCFWYEDFNKKPCWGTFRHNGKLMVRIASVTNREVQVVEEITDIPVVCSNTPMS